MSEPIHVYVYHRPLMGREVLTDGPVEVGGAPIGFADDSTLVWIDLQPRARFAHDTLYALLSPGRSTVVNGQWWPVLNGEKILYGLTDPIVVSADSVAGGGRLPNKDAGGLSDDTAGDGRLPDRPQGVGEGCGTMPPFSIDLGELLSRVQARVYTVDSLSVSFEKRMPPVPLIAATGKTRTTGWTNAQLVPRVYVTPPPDGIWEFDFVATPPLIGGFMISPISAFHRYLGDASGWRGVRVYSETNSQEVLF